MVKFKASKRVVTIVIVIGVLLLAVAAGLGLYWWQNNGADKRTIPKEATDAQNSALKGDFNKAHETINDALKNPNLSVQSKYDLLMQQAYTYEAQKDSKAAMDTYLQAEAVMETMDVAQCIARLAADKGDKELAITYYKKAITLIPKDDSMSIGSKQYFENMITVLQGGQPKL